MNLIIVPIALFFTVSSCIETVKVAPTIQELGVNANQLQLEFGRTLYLTRCAKCHNALRITRFTESQWSEIMPDMTFKSKFIPEQSEAVTAYVHAVLRSSSTSTK